jgi:DNA modification methylase
MTCGRKIGQFDCCSVVQGDCNKLMAGLGFHTIDLVFADPPYGIGKARWDATYPSGFEAECVRVGKQVAITPGQWAIRECIENLGVEFVGIIAARNLNGMTFSPIGFGNWIPTMIAGAVKRGQDAFEFTVGGEKPDHPSPKPIEFMLKLIERLTEPGDIVLDPFLGSGTTAVAAKKLRRHFLGFEIDANYCRLAEERLTRIDAQPSLFQPKPEQLQLT